MRRLFYPWGRLDYIRNLKTNKSVSVRVMFLEISSKTILERKCNFWSVRVIPHPGAGRRDTDFSESVKCRFSKCRFSVLNLKFDFISDGGGTREKQIQKALDSLPPCGNRCRFSESAICFSRVRPPSEIKSNFKFKTLRWRPLRWRLTLSEFPLFMASSEDISWESHQHSGVQDGCASSIGFSLPSNAIRLPEDLLEFPTLCVW